MFPSEGLKILLLRVTAVGNLFRFLQACLVLESCFLHAIQQVVPQNPVKPRLGILNVLATTTGNKKAEKDLLQAVLTHFAIFHKRVGESEQPGRILSIEFYDLGFD